MRLFLIEKPQLSTVAVFERPGVFEGVIWIQDFKILRRKTVRQKTERFKIIRLKTKEIKRKACFIIRPILLTLA
jgi:hypothetical protein